MRKDLLKPIGPIGRVFTFTHTFALAFTLGRPRALGRAVLLPARGASIAHEVPILLLA
jgi:hypothetical protein